MNYDLHTKDSFSFIEDGVASMLTGTVLEKMQALADNLSKAIAIRNVESLGLYSEIPHNDLHIYKAYPGSGSYPFHKDEKDVLVYLAEGTKIFYTPEERFDLEEGSWLYIPKGLLHKAEVTSESTLYSFGRLA